MLGYSLISLKEKFSMTLEKSRSKIKFQSIFHDGIKLSYEPQYNPMVYFSKFSLSSVVKNVLTNQIFC